MQFDTIGVDCGVTVEGRIVCWGDAREPVAVKGYISQIVLPYALRNDGSVVQFFSGTGTEFFSATSLLHFLSLSLCFTHSTIRFETLFFSFA